MEDDFYTLNGYAKQRHQELSPAMEDYLEMIYRNLTDDNYMRINVLATNLHVTPPSASKMVNKLKLLGFVTFEPYGLIKLTDKGKEKGCFLLKRHNVLNELFCLINHSNSELVKVEQIEHFVDETTVHNIENFLADLI